MPHLTKRVSLHPLRDPTEESYAGIEESATTLKQSAKQNRT